MQLLNTGAYCGRTFEAAEPKPAGPKVGDTTSEVISLEKSQMVERWNGYRWTEKKLVWNGQAYVEDK